MTQRRAERRELAEACVRAGLDEFDAGDWTEETAQAIAARVLAEHDAARDEAERGRTT